MNRNFKFIASVMACSQLFACASNGYSVPVEDPPPLVKYQLKATGKLAQTVGNDSLAALDNEDLSVQVEYLASTSTGLIFRLSIENKSPENHDMLWRNISCQQRNLTEQNNRYPILSEFEALADYDKVINEIHNPRRQSDGSGGVAEGIGFFIAVVAVLAIIADIDSSKKHNSHKHHDRHSRQHTSANHYVHESHSHFSDFMNLLALLPEPNQQISEVSVDPNDQDAARIVARHKQAQKEKLLKSQTLAYGDAISGLIYCPFDSIGDAGVSVVYDQYLFEFEKMERN